MIPNIDSETKIEEASKIEELTGKLDKEDSHDKLMHSVIENDEDTVNDGKLISDVVNQGFSSFTPDMMFDTLTKDYALAKSIMGESLIRLVTGYDANYVKKNINIPEFQRELRERINNRVDQMKEKELLSDDGEITEEGYYLSSLIMYTEELDKLTPVGFGEKVKKDKDERGEIDSYRNYHKGDRFRDIAIRRSIKQVLRRGHDRITQDDLRTVERKSKGAIYIVYAVDASGSMKGKKIEAAKKAGIALAFKAIEKKDNVGLMVFGKDVEEKIKPSRDFPLILDRLARIRAAKETDITRSIREGIDLFPKKRATKHLILITDAMPTVGKKPEKEVLEIVSMARDQGITVSLVGIGLDKKGREFAEHIVSISEGKLYVVRNLEELDQIILEDYYNL